MCILFDVTLKNIFCKPVHRASLLSQAVLFIVGNVPAYVYIRYFGRFPGTEIVRVCFSLFLRRHITFEINIAFSENTGNTAFRNQ